MARKFGMAEVYLAQYLRSLGNALDVMRPRVGQIGVKGVWWGVPQAAGLLAKFIGAPVTGVIGEVAGIRLTLMYLYASLCLINIAALFATEFWQFVVLRTLLGFNWMCTPMLMVYVTQHTAGPKRELARRTARVRAFRTLGMMTAPLIFAQLRGWPMEMAFGVASVVFAVNFGVAYFLLADSPPGQPSGSEGAPVTPAAAQEAPLVPRLRSALGNHFRSARHSIASALQHPMLASSFVINFVRPAMFLGPYTIQIFGGGPEQISWLAAAQAASSLVLGFTGILAILLRLTGSVKAALLTGHLGLGAMSLVAVSMPSIPMLGAALFVRSLFMGIVKACEQVMWVDVDASVAATTTPEGRGPGDAKRGLRPGHSGAVGQREALVAVGGVFASLTTGYLTGRDVRLLYLASAAVSVADVACIQLWWSPSPGLSVPGVGESTGEGSGEDPAPMADSKPVGAGSEASIAMGIRRRRAARSAN